MPFHKSSDDHCKVVFFVPGINGGVTFGLVPFTKALGKVISPDRVVYAYSDPRLEDPDPNMASEARDFATIAADIVSQMQTKQPDASEYHVILYSFSCLLAPYLQKYINDQGRTVQFTLIDQPTLEVIQCQPINSNIKWIADIFIRIAITLGLDTKNTLSERTERTLARSLNINASVIGTLFDEIIPNFEAQIKKLESELEIQSANPATTEDERYDLMQRLAHCQQVPILIRSNLITLFTTQTKPEEGAVLQEAQIISTPKTCQQYGIASPMGWEAISFKTIPLEGTADHFSIMNPDDPNGNCEALITFICAWHKLHQPINTISYSSSQDPPQPSDVEMRPISRKRSYIEKVTDPTKRRKLETALDTVDLIFSSSDPELVKQEKVEELVANLYTETEASVPYPMFFHHSSQPSQSPLPPQSPLPSQQPFS